jgi:hypothetical protein
MDAAVPALQRSEHMKRYQHNQQWAKYGRCSCTRCCIRFAKAWGVL